MRLNLIISQSLLVFAIALPTYIASAQPVPQPAPVVPAQPGTPAKVATAIEWETSFDAALAKGEAMHKPVMVTFTADWCPACRMLENNIYKNSRVIAESDNSINVKVNVDHQPEIVKRYGVTAMPTLVWLDSDGQVLYSLEGVAPVSELVQEMQTALAIYQEQMAAQTNAKPY